MYTPPENTETTTPSPEKTKRMEACIAVGIEKWIDCCLTENGRECMEKLPTDRVRDRAAEIFLLGFVGRMLAAPPIGDTLMCCLTEEKDLNRLWIHNLETSGGEIILDGFPYPHTDEATLLLAKAFFRLGFRAGIVHYRQRAGVDLANDFLLGFWGERERPADSSERKAMDY